MTGWMRLLILFSLLRFAMYAASPVCSVCHPQETARFLASRMGKSFGPPEPLPPGRVIYKPSGSVVIIQERNGRMVQRLSEHGLTAEYPIAYRIGSGARGRSFAVAVGNYLLEAPASWYRSHGWDASPGYESLPLVDFDRPVTSSCLFCHAGNAKFADADGRRLANVNVTSISCSRCHGPTANHIHHPSADNIVNPAHLSGAARDSICEQCHLEGTTRFLNPGKTLRDFHPGQPLENTLVTYMLRRSGQNRAAVNEEEELAESKCARASGGRLWCGTCHNPHGPPVKDRQHRIRQICMSCHPTLSKAAHQKPPAECVSCHMPSRGTSDIAHVAVVDHRIRRPNEGAGVPYRGPDTVVAWREPPAAFRQRDLGLAELRIGFDRHLPAMTSAGTMLLQTLPPRQQNNDPGVLSTLEAVYLGKMAPDKAVELGRWAVDTAPQSAIFAMNFGLALKRSGNLRESERQFLRAIDLDPSLTNAYAELAVLYDSEGRTSDAIKTIDRFLLWNPKNIQFRLARRP
ncbi:MAG: cytochrome c3 family protein [Bryobacteraceae bacterium]